jgi:tetratricopeptide (TPR) repeat protein
MTIFQQAAKRWPGAWPTDVGIARAYSAMGDYKQALKHARAALAIAPDDLNRKNLERMIGLLEQGKDMNQ